MRRPRAVVAGIGLIAVTACALVMRPYAHGLTFIVRATGMQGAIRRLADADTRTVIERRLDVTVTQGRLVPIPARLYRPTTRPRRLVLLASGLHPAGIDEPRLVELARQLAASGLAVVTPDIPELSRYEITPAITDEIEAAALWAFQLSESERATAGDGRIGLMGISFSGGLSVVAAGRPSLRDRVAYVLSLGGHDDLPRVLRYLCTGREPRPGQLGPGRNTVSHDAAATFVRRPHDYGVAVILLAVADRVVPQPQVDHLREAVRRFLAASVLERVDRVRAQADFAELRALVPTLPEPSSTLLTYLNERDVIHLGHALLPYIGEYGNASSLSPSRSDKPSAPVFLLHGTDDNVVPTIESEYLAEDLRGHAPVRLLQSDLISHAEADRQPSAGDVMRLAAFWGDLLAR
jgi:dienelactone hydrolase